MNLAVEGTLLSIKAVFVVLLFGRCNFYFILIISFSYFPKILKNVLKHVLFLFPVLSYKKSEAESHIIHIASIVLISNLQNYMKKC